MAAKRSAPNEDLSNVEFETSEEVEVVPTFQSMNLREELLRGVYAYGKCRLILITRFEQSKSHLIKINKYLTTQTFRLRETISYSAAFYTTYREGSRCNCASSIWYW